MTGVAAVIAHLTAVGHTTPSGYLTAFPTGYVRPATSSLNFTLGATVSNAIVVPVGADGTISIFNLSGTTHAVLDIQGWIAAPNLTTAGPSVAFSTAPLITADGRTARQILNNANRYAMTTWWDGSPEEPATRFAPYLLGAELGPGEASTANHDAVRRLSMQALSLSTALASGAYDEAATGVSAPIARQRAVQLVDHVASWHVTNRPGGWGDDWQSSMWTGLVGRAAWFIWADLPSDSRQRVAQMVAHEASFAARMRIHYLRDAAGHVLTDGDTGAEEVAWNATASRGARHAQPPTAQRVEDRDVLRRWPPSRPQDVADLAGRQRRTPVRLAERFECRYLERSSSSIMAGCAHGDYTHEVAGDDSQNLDAAPLFARAGRQSPQAMMSLAAKRRRPGSMPRSGTSRFSSPPYARPRRTDRTRARRLRTIVLPRRQRLGYGPTVALRARGHPGGRVRQRRPVRPASTRCSATAQLALQSRDGHADGRTYTSDHRIQLRRT